MNLNNVHNNDKLQSIEFNDENKNLEGILQILNMKLTILTFKFKDYLTIRSKNIEKQEERKSKLNFVDEKLMISNRWLNSFKEFTNKRKSNRSSTILSIYEHEEEQLINPSQSNCLDQIEFIENRTKNIESIKELLSEINQIFLKFSEIVNEQELMVLRIDSDTEIALNSIEKGRKELEKHYISISSYRTLLFKIFLMIIVFLTLYIILI